MRVLGYLSSGVGQPRTVSAPLVQKNARDWGQIGLVSTQEPGTRSSLRYTYSPPPHRGEPSSSRYGNIPETKGETHPSLPDVDPGCDVESTVCEQRFQLWVVSGALFVPDGASGFCNF